MGPQAHRSRENHPASAQAATLAALAVPEQVTAATGFVEGPTLSPDGRSLYFHRLENGAFRICRVTR